MKTGMLFISTMNPGNNPIITKITYHQKLCPRKSLMILFRSRIFQKIIYIMENRAVRNGAITKAVNVWVWIWVIQRAAFTVVKRLLGLRVLKETGLPIGYKEAFLRRLSLYLEIIAVDALFILFTARRQRAFDIVARTIVIHEAS